MSRGTTVAETALSAILGHICVELIQQTQLNSYCVHNLERTKRLFGTILPCLCHRAFNQKVLDFQGMLYAQVRNYGTRAVRHSNKITSPVSGTRERMHIVYTFHMTGLGYWSLCMSIAHWYTSGANLTALVQGGGTFPSCKTVELIFMLTDESRLSRNHELPYTVCHLLTKTFESG